MGKEEKCGYFYLLLLHEGKPMCITGYAQNTKGFASADTVSGRVWYFFAAHFTCFPWATCREL